MLLADIGVHQVNGVISNVEGTFTFCPFDYTGLRRDQEGLDQHHELY
jgi:hypothetical protein